MTKKVYLACPEVFLVNAREILDEKIALTREAGLVPVSPVHNSVVAQARSIFDGQIPGAVEVLHRPCGCAQCGRSRDLATLLPRVPQHLLPSLRMPDIGAG